MSRLCRLKTAKHGDDGKWAHDEIVRLREENSRLSDLCDTWNSECDDYRAENRHLANMLQEALKQRDDLLAALERIASGEAENGSILSVWEYQEIANDAIARVKGACVQQSAENETQAGLTRTDDTQTRAAIVKGGAAIASVKEKQ